MANLSESGFIGLGLTHQNAVGMDGFGFRAHPDMNARRATGSLRNIVETNVHCVSPED